MSWRVGTTHRSHYRYGTRALSSYNELRMTPKASERQRVLESELLLEPAAAVFTYRDYWGTVVQSFDVQVPHEALEVVARSVVETSAPAPLPEDGPDWSALRDEDVADRFAELLVPTAYAPFNPNLAGLARGAAEGATPAEAVRRIGELVRSHLRYEAGTTAVTTSALQAWAQGSGVCQDFAHLTVALLRQVGIPARYTSGYLHPKKAAVVGERVSAASHAWVEAWLGRWWPLDPTNGDPVGERHVTVAHGRDYSDVAPFIGIYQGGALLELEVEVVLERLA
ncbi:MAG: transglutaminase protein [Acidimicrobiaceae bacterium]|nr:transglutaminase protein [Acidimicrobiaceae bacterium]